MVADRIARAVSVSSSRRIGYTRRTASTPSSDTPLIETRRIRSPSTIEMALISASHSFPARCPIVSNTGLRSLSDLEIIGGGGLLLQCFRKLARARLHLVEQAHVLDRNHGLVGKDRGQLNLLF